jgi:integrase
LVRHKETKAPVSIFTPENIASLLAKADVTLKPFIAMSAFAGLRTTELRRLDWSEVDLSRSTFHVFLSQGAHGDHNRAKRFTPTV